MASNLHTFTGNEVIATEVPSYLNQNFTNLNTDKADKSTTYTKSEVDSLVANSGGGSEGCLKTTGGVFNGTSEFVDFLGEPKVGTLYETSQDSPSLKLTIDDTLDIGSRTVESDEATGILLSGSNISLGNEALIALAPTVMMGGIAKNEMYEQMCSTYVGQEGEHQSSITLFPGVSSNILDNYYLNDSMTATAGAYFSGISGASLSHSIPLYGKKELKVCSDSDTPLWNDQPMPLTVNGLTPDTNGNIEISGGGSVDESKFYAPTNYYMVSGGTATTTPFGMSGYTVGTCIKIYDPVENAGSPPPRYYRVKVSSVGDEGSLPFDSEVAVCVASSADLANYAEDNVDIVMPDVSVTEVWGKSSTSLSSELLPVPFSDNKPIWVVFLTIGVGTFGVSAEDLANIRIQCYRD